MKKKMLITWGGMYLTKNERRYSIPSHLISYVCQLHAFSYYMLCFNVTTPLAFRHIDEETQLMDTFISLLENVLARYIAWVLFWYHVIHIALILFPCRIKSKSYSLSYNFLEKRILHLKRTKNCRLKDFCIFYYYIYFLTFIALFLYLDRNV